jgi:curved DNA-binding protein CbpA
MSFEFKNGLFKFDFTDQNAILGVPIDAEFNDIRKCYMKIARRLHPDTCPFEPEDKELANQLLSKLVSPAYDKFSKESARAEYFVILSNLQKRLAEDKNKTELSSEKARQIATSGNYREAYNSAVSELAKEQYETLARTLEIIEELSELNLAYLLNKKTPTDKKKPPAPARPIGKSALVEKACDRAESLIASNKHSSATLELREALKQEPNHSRAHGLLAYCYWQQNQMTMAKMEAKKALAIDPKEPKALEVQKQLEKGGSQGKTQAKKGKSDKGGGGFLGGLFGGGKKE